MLQLLKGNTNQSFFNTAHSSPPSSWPSSQWSWSFAKRNIVQIKAAKQPAEMGVDEKGQMQTEESGWQKKGTEHSSKLRHPVASATRRACVLQKSTAMLMGKTSCHCVTYCHSPLFIFALAFCPAQPSRGTAAGTQILCQAHPPNQARHSFRHGTEDMVFSGKTAWCQTNIFAPPPPPPPPLYPVFCWFFFLGGGGRAHFCLCIIVICLVVAIFSSLKHFLNTYTEFN